MEEQDRKYQAARRRVRQLKDFYIHGVCYVMINALLFGINYFTNFEYKWFIWPLMGWGLGLAFHALSVFGLGGFLGQEWEERKIREIMDRDKR